MAKHFNLIEGGKEEKVVWKVYDAGRIKRSPVDKGSLSLFRLKITANPPTQQSGSSIEGGEEGKRFNGTKHKTRSVCHL